MLVPHPVNDNSPSGSKKTMKLLMSAIGAIACLALGFYGFLLAASPSEYRTMTGITDDSSSGIVVTDSATGIIEDHRRLNIKSNNRWKERFEGRVIIPYKLSAMAGNEATLIRFALDELEEKTGCLKFVERTTELSYIDVTNESFAGCYSKVGKVGGPQTLNLDSFSDCFTMGIIQHEFIHALGFGHEQNRPDRDNYVTIYEENIENPQMAHNFEKASSQSSTTMGSPYDYDSIMHYSSTAFAKAGTNTIVSKNWETTFGQAEGPTDIDIQKLKLLYQCEYGIIRDWNSLTRSPCTSDCKCRKNDMGCGTDDDACHGSLVCINDKCQEGQETDTTQPINLYTPKDDELWKIYRKDPDEKEKYCMDLTNGIVENTNRVRYQICDDSTSQLWYWDEVSGYVMPAIDHSKCLVPVGGEIEKGNELMIWDCIQNDDRFRWVYWNDKSITPRIDKWLCVEQESVLSKNQEFEPLILDDCHEGYMEWKFSQGETDGRLLVETPNGSEMNCDDVPLGWYDFLGRNCLWYGEDTSRCEIYGGSFRNFGRTALSACCVCGGGSTAISSNGSDHLFSDLIGSEANIVAAAGSCWNMPDFLDSTGDGCDWYEKDENYCGYFGWQFTNTYGVNANMACCVCGAGLDHPPEPTEFISEQSGSVPRCSNNPYSWYDVFGDDCSWYEQYDNCALYGEIVGSGGLTANQVCCACGGGLQTNGGAWDARGSEGGLRTNGIASEDP